MSALRLASILVVGLVQVCFAADVKQMSASHKPFFTSQMIELATGGNKTVPNSNFHDMCLNSFLEL